MRANNKLGLLLRGAYGGAAVLFYFLGIAHLPVGIATLLNYTAPGVHGDLRGRVPG